MSELTAFALAPTYGHQNQSNRKSQSLGVIPLTQVVFRLSPFQGFRRQPKSGPRAAVTAGGPGTERRNLPMHHKANRGRSQRPQDHAQDVRDQAVVLTFVLALNGDHLTIPDLARTLNEKPRDFKRPDAVERAVRDLTGVGLVEIDAARVQPTTAALRFIEIIERGV